MRKQIIISIAVMCCFMTIVTGCGSGKVDVDMGLAQTDVSTIAVPEDVLVVGLGEASHGVKEYQEMKAGVFQALVAHNGCRTFVIEGDFGNALKVDDYIHGGSGTAKEAAALIGFRIYRTEEMEELIQWMRSYNETAGDGEDLHFYGMDMQWADSSKEYVFQILEQIDSNISSQYREAFAFLNDDEMYDISSEAFEQGLSVAESLIQEVDSAEENIVEMFGSETFAYARECAQSIYNCCDIRKSDREYNAVRDRHMAEKVKWFIEHGDGSVIFINGHNGHIGKVNCTPNYDCLGRLLAQELGEGYFAIGTDAEVTSFNSQTDDGFEELRVENQNFLNALTGELAQNYYYIDFSAASADDRWSKIISDKQRITSLNVTAMTATKAFYTTKIIPKDTFDGMIVFSEVSPTTLDQ
ncbi:MAG: erythromycin esterase family protein [Lachnospiraceae bacterium]|nr:erythromycin esterase family protein [Lachnospiraceae bacterium]